MREMREVREGRDPSGAIPAGTVLTGEDCARLAQLVEMWRFYGRSMNLVGQHGASAAVQRQLGESLLVARLASHLGVPWRGELRDGAGMSSWRWLDVGSGAGFPGLVIAALLDVEVTFVEPRAKRAAFLELALSAVSGRGRVFCARLEAFEGSEGGRERGTFQIATARAVFSPEAWLVRGAGWVTADGCVIVEAHSDTPALLGWGPETRLDAPPWSARAFRVGRGEAPRGAGVAEDRGAGGE
jgi:16S rRNA (guanine527-N7)-methyltransferase